MSDWTSVTSKTKPPSVEPAALTTADSPPQDTDAIITTTRLRAEFLVHPGSKIFQPVPALRGLFKALLQQHPDLTIYNVAGDHHFAKVDDIPGETTHFGKHFVVSPHLGRNGGGRVHLHFNIPTKYSLHEIKQSYHFLNYLKQNRVWLTQHKFTDNKIITAGYIFLKSPYMTLSLIHI